MTKPQSYKVIKCFSWFTQLSMKLILFKMLNKNTIVSSFGSNENTQRRSLGHIGQFQIVNPSKQ